MFAVEDALYLPVPLARVWRLLADVDRYQDWHPFLRLQQIPGKPMKVTYTHRRKGKDFLTVDADIVRLDRQEAIAWRIGIRGLLELEEGFTTAKDGQGTRLVHRMRCSGICSPLVSGKLRQGLLDMLVATDASLRRHLSRATTTTRYSQGQH